MTTSDGILRPRRGLKRGGQDMLTLDMGMNKWCARGGHAGLGGGVPAGKGGSRMVSGGFTGKTRAIMPI